MRDEVSWLTDFTVLFRDEALYKISFFECENKEYTERFNELTRFVIWYSVILSLIKSDMIYILITLLMGACTFFLKRITSVERMDAFKPNSISKYSNNSCSKVTKNNPFGNPSVGFKTSIPTCKNQFKQSEEYFFEDLPIDPLDPFKRQAQQRQFYTMPVTTDINSQSEFANWLYN